MACELKSRAAGARLPLLVMEEALMVAPNETNARNAVAEDITREWRLARLAANDMLGQQAGNAELAKELVYSKEHDYLFIFTEINCNTTAEPQSIHKT